MDTDSERTPENTSSSRRTLLQLILFSAGESRLRAGWRLLLQVVLLILLVFGLEFILGYYLIPRSAVLQDNSFFLSQLILLISVTFSVLFARTVFDGRSFRSLGLTGKRAGVELGLGFLIGGSVMGLIFLIAWSLGWLRIQGFAWEANSLGSTALETGLFLIVFLAVSWQEELLFRGYWLQNLEEGLNLIWAVGITSLFFAVAHWGNPLFSLRPLAGLLLGSLLLSAGYLVTRRLWMPVGIHLGWNFLGGVVLGFPVGGLQIPSLIKHSPVGPDWLMGGSFGPEGGLLLLPGLAVGFFMIWAYSVYADPGE